MPMILIPTVRMGFGVSGRKLANPINALHGQLLVSLECEKVYQRSRETEPPADCMDSAPSAQKPFRAG
jgi:hypothetical protein